MKNFRTFPSRNNEGMTVFCDTGTKIDQFGRRPGNDVLHEQILGTGLCSDAFQRSKGLGTNIPNAMAKTLVYVLSNDLGWNHET